MKDLIRKDPAREGARPLNTIGAILFCVFLILSEINKLVKSVSGFNKKQTKSWFHFWFIPVMAFFVILVCIWLFLLGIKLIPKIASLIK